jgi:hypothetical protein
MEVVDWLRKQLDDDEQVALAARSEMMRRMLAYAAAHMPAGWKP